MTDPINDAKQCQGIKWQLREILIWSGMKPGKYHIGPISFVGLQHARWPGFSLSALF